MPHPFTWVPAGRARHASADPVPHGHSFQTGTELTTLCGKRLTADNSQVAWFWATCVECRVATYELAGVKAPPTQKTAE